MITQTVGRLSDASCDLGCCLAEETCHIIDTTSAHFAAFKIFLFMFMSSMRWPRTFDSRRASIRLVK